MTNFLKEIVNNEIEVREDKYILKWSIQIKINPEFKRMFDKINEVSSMYHNHEAE